MAKLTQSNWRNLSTTVFALAAFAVLGLRTWAEAEVYFYKDARGVYHFTTKPRAGAEPFRIAPTRRPATEPAVARSTTMGGSGRYDELIRECARRYAVDPALVKAVIHAESGFNRHVVSRRGARGLMQLMPRTARIYGVRDLSDARQNVLAGVKHLRALLDRFGNNIRLAVAAYNAGATAVRRHGGLPPFPETRRYVARVFRFHAQYRSDERMAALEATGISEG
jgi:soluble lytic murein transglycosylase-like protein